MALNLGVTSCQSLEISLDQFVRGEVLEGSNAYYCEKCKEKVCIVLCMLSFCHTDIMCTYNVYSCPSAQRTTVKRTCIKSLPSVLCIHLMRFGFDWESGRSIKYDEQIRVCISRHKSPLSGMHWFCYTPKSQKCKSDFYEFCIVAAQFPWVLNMEPYTVAGMARQDCSGEGGEGRGDGTSGGSPRKKVTISENYELVGVVVHSGQAHAGHYYSFIKDRR